MALGLKDGADARAQMSPLRGSTTAVAASAYGASAASAVRWRSGWMVSSTSAPGTSGFTATGCGGPLAGWATRLTDAFPRSSASAPASTPRRPASCPAA